MWDMFSLHPIRASHSWQMPWLLQTLDPPQLLLTQAVIPTLHLCVIFSLPRRTVLCLSLPNCTSLISDCGQWHADEFKFWNAHKPLCLVTCRMWLRRKAGGLGSHMGFSWGSSGRCQAGDTYSLSMGLWIVGTACTVGACCAVGVAGMQGMLHLLP